MINEKCDFHTHATDYRKDNGCTVEAIIERSQELGLDIIGVGDHITSRLPFEIYRTVVAEYHRQSPSIRSYLGAEVDILDRDGQVSCTPELKEELGIDYLNAAIHQVSLQDFASVDEYVEEAFSRMMATVRGQDHVDILAHPWSKGRRYENWSFALIPDEYKLQLIEAAREHGKAIELNGKQMAPDDEAYVAFYRDISDAGVPVSVGSDAHDKESMSRSLKIINFLNELGFEDKHLWKPFR